MIPKQARLLVIAAVLAAAPASLAAATYYADSVNGDDSAAGTSATQAKRSIAGVNQLNLAPGDRVLFRRGQFFDGTLEIRDDGRAGEPVTVGSFGSGGNQAELFGLFISANYVTIDGVDIDHRQHGSDAVRVRDARHVVLRNMSISNGTRDAIDANLADDLTVEDVEISLFLNGSFGSMDDSHGLAVTSTNGVTVRRANIHHVSGDSIQVDPNRVPGAISDNILVEDSIFWTGPLQRQFNSGWPAGASPGENALDTKVLKSGFENEIRMKITLRNVIAYGWTPIPEMPNRAAFNLKEKIRATLDRVTVYDSEIAFRVRGALGNADTLIANAVVHDVRTAIRAEDDLDNLKVYNSTFGDGIGTQLQTAGGNGGSGSWDWRNNAFVGSLPAPAAGDASNRLANAGDFVDAAGRDYRLEAGSPLIGSGVPIAAVRSDRDGAARNEPYDVGAFAFTGTAVRRPMPPVLRIE